MPAECCAHRHVSTSGLKGITLRLNAMTPSATFKIDLGKKHPCCLKCSLPLPCSLLRTCDLLVCLGRISSPLLLLPLQLLILEPAWLYSLLKNTAALHPLYAPAIDLDPPIFMSWKTKWLFREAFVWNLESARALRQNSLNFSAWLMCQSAQSSSQSLVLVLL